LERKGYISQAQECQARTSSSRCGGYGNANGYYSGRGKRRRDDLSLFAAEERDEFLEVDRELVDISGDIVAVRAVATVW